MNPYLIKIPPLTDDRFMSRSCVAFVSAMLLLLTIAPPSIWSADEFDLLPRNADSRIGVELPTGSSIVTLNVDVYHHLRGSHVEDQVLIRLPLTRSETILLQLNRQHVFSDGSKITAQTPQGPVQIPRPPSLLFVGSILGQPFSHVTLAVNDRWVLGSITTGGSDPTHYMVSPLPGQPVPTSVIVEAGSLYPPEAWHCSFDDGESVGGGDRAGKGGEGTQASKKRIDIALECDEPYYIDHGRNLQDAILYAEAVIGAVSALYDRDVDAVLNIKELTVWTTTDPYPGTTSTNMLTQLRAEWRANHTTVQRTVVHLFSGVNGIGGVAYLNGLCSTSNGYAVSGLNNNITYPRTTYAWDTDVTAHELGHNVGSPHTHSCTWNPPIDSCYTAEGGCFTATKAVKGTIMSYCHLTNLGKNLDFHPRVQTLMRTRLGQANCVQTISDLVVTANMDTAICYGTSIDLWAAVSGGTAPYTVSWTPSAGLSDPTSLTTSAQPNTTTTYTVTVIDDLQVSRNAQFTVFVNPRMNPQTAALVDVCEGQTVVLRVTGAGGTPPYQVQWQSTELDTATTDTILGVSPTEDQSVIITVRDSEGCSATITSNIVMHPTPSVTCTEPPEALCPGEPFYLQANVVSTEPTTVTWYRSGRVVNVGPDYSGRADSTASLTIVARTKDLCADTTAAVIRVRNINVRVTTPLIPLPDMAPCDNDFQAWVTIVNSGADTATISSITALRGSVTCPDLPLVMPPSSSQVLPLFISIPDAENIEDTLTITEERCGSKLIVVVRGSTGMVSTLQDQKASYEMASVCAKPVHRSTDISFQNSSPYPCTIQSVRSRFYQRPLVIKGNAVVNGHSSATLTFELYAPVDASVVTDSLDIVYRSTSCSGEIHVAVAHPTTVTSWQAPFTLDFTEAVSQNLEDVSVDTSITIMSDGLATVAITGVAIEGPFGTDLVVGSVLPTNTSYPVSIWFKPSELKADGVAKGSISISLDSCGPLAPAIVLTGQRRVVGVAEAGAVSTPKLNEPRVVQDELRIAKGPCTVVISDISGRTVLMDSTMDGGVVRLGTLHTGVYGVTLVRQGNDVQRFVIFKQ